MNAVALQGNLVDPIVALVLLLVIIVVVFQSVEIVGPLEHRVLTVFGQYRRMLEPGVNFVPPFISKSHSIDISLQQIDVPPQTVTTRDDVPIMADITIHTRITDAKNAFFEAGDYKRSMLNRAQTALRERLTTMEFGEGGLDDMDPDEREARWKEIRSQIENEYEERTGVDPNDMSNEDWETIQTEIHTRAQEEFTAIDDGLKKRMEITDRISTYIEKELETMTDGWGVKIFAVGVDDLIPNPDTHHESDQHGSSSSFDPHRNTE